MLAYILMTALLMVQTPPQAASEINDIQVYPGSVWTASCNGLSVYQPDNATLLFTMTSAHGLPSSCVKTLSKLDQNHLLVVTDRGAVVLSNIKHAKDPSQIEKRLLQHRGAVVTVVQSNRRFYLHRFWQHLVPVVIDSTANSEWDQWRAAAVGQVLVVGSGDGTLEFFPAHKQRPVISMNIREPIADLEALGDDLIVATGDTLLVIQRGQIEELVLHSPDGQLSPVPATKLARFDEQILVGTADGAVYSLRGRQLTPLSPSTGHPVTALAASGSTIWAGLESIGLLALNGVPLQSTATLARGFPAKH